jgi:hypothetical protein
MPELSEKATQTAKSPAEAQYRKATAPEQISSQAGKISDERVVVFIGFSSD